MSSDIAQRWRVLEQQLTEQFGKKPDLNSILLLIGIRELGTVKEEFSKQEKVDLMHIAVCKLLSQQDYYKLEGLDQDGWPHWKLVKPLPFINVFEQEIYLRELVLDYFDNL
ncbi:MAG TPA: hypothetical protein VEC12_14700 [Bacteroidia bacterium]|nr:hypothetical protein [Bacteroidia bacterium]